MPTQYSPVPLSPFSSVLLPQHLLVCRGLLCFDPCAVVAVGRTSSSNILSLPHSRCWCPAPCRLLFLQSLPRASSCSEPSCATSAELEREGIWPHPPVSLPPFGDLRCLSVYRSVCKDQATHPHPLLRCFNSAGCPGWRDQIMGEAGAHM